MTNGFKFLAKKNPEKFYGIRTFRCQYGIRLCDELGIYKLCKKYNKEYYLKKREAFCKASKKYCAKKKSQNSSS